MLCQMAFETQFSHQEINIAQSQNVTIGTHNFFHAYGPKYEIGNQYRVDQPGWC